MAVAVEYSGKLLAIFTEKTSYAENELVRAKVNFEVTRTGPGWSAWLYWHAWVQVYVDEVLKDEQAFTFTIAPWTSVDTEKHTTRWLEMGKMPARNMNGRIAIWCADKPL